MCLFYIYISLSLLITHPLIFPVVAGDIPIATLRSLATPSTWTAECTCPEQRQAEVMKQLFYEEGRLNT